MSQRLICLSACDEKPVVTSMLQSCEKVYRDRSLPTSYYLLKLESSHSRILRIRAAKPLHLPGSGGFGAALAESECSARGAYT